jgi:hypothetical protein
MREQKVDALVVVFATEGISGLGDSLFTCITNSAEEAEARLWNFRLDGIGFTAISRVRTSKAKVLKNKIGQVLLGSHHIY